MANQRSTRVQRICKKLQTVRGASPAGGGSAFLEGRSFCLVVRENERGASSAGERGAWAGSFLEGNWCF